MDGNLQLGEYLCRSLDLQPYGSGSRVNGSGEAVLTSLGGRCASQAKCAGRQYMAERLGISRRQMDPGGGTPPWHGMWLMVWRMDGT